MRLFALVVSMIILTFAEKVTYDNYKVFKMRLKTQDELKFIRNLIDKTDGVDIWSIPRTSTPTSLMVAPESLEKFIKQMVKSKIKFDLVHENVQALIDHQVSGGTYVKGFGWNRYHTLSEINSWLENLPKKFPNVIEVINGGRSFENRDINGVKISYRQNNSGIFIEAGIHADEWISPATATYLINEFLTSTDPKVRNLAESYDWYIFPSLNPDGYTYTYTTNRMWHKNRSYGINGCVGTDLNRNWNHMWMKIGASNDSCHLNYAGRYPFSEIEAKTMSEYLKSIKDKLFAHISFHSYSQLLMVPYGYTKEHLDNYEETYAIGLKSAHALARRYGTKYGVGSSAEFYTDSGSSNDWVKGILKLPIVYTYELRDQGYYGMLLPPEQIIPTGQEVLDSLIVMFEEARKLGYPKLK